MSVMFLTTIGGRDLLLDGKEIKPARIKGQQILTDFDNLAIKPTTPILEVAIDFILRHSSTIDRIVLIATDQPETELPRYRDNDTIAFAEIIRRLLIKRKRIKDFRIVYIRQNPSNVDDMFDFFKEILSRNKAFKIDALERCYTLTTGGVPGANTALLMQSIEHYREKSFPLYVSEKTGHIVPLRIGNQMLRSFRDETISKSLARYDYSAIVTLLSGQGDSGERFCYDLADYAKHRLYFDTDRALGIIEDTLGRASGQDRQLCESLLKDLDPLRNGEKLALVRELFYNLRVKLIREEYVDFLGRVFRFQEDVLRYIVEKEYKVTTNLDKKEHRYVEFITEIERNDSLKNYLVGTRYQGKPLNYEEPTIPCLTSMIRFLTDINDDGRGNRMVDDESQIEDYRKILEIFKKASNLSQLRNKSIIAHGYNGVSKEIMKKEYGGGDITADLREVAMLIGIDDDDSPFDLVNRQIKEMLHLES